MRALQVNWSQEMPRLTRGGGGGGDAAIAQ